MAKPMIKVEHLSKQYKIGVDRKYKTFQDAIMNTVKSMPLFFNRKSQDNNAFWALRDISFEVEESEVVGIIGRNGAGKSTLLKLLSRITEPTEGRIKLRGRVGSLLEVGTGFHPELTGRENIYLNGSILGMRKREIDEKFDEIIKFAEIEKFLDTPVKRYSSGMYVRLAFAVAAHLEPEILLVDEVLAVGDAAFQKKCLGKIGSVAKEGRTVLFVSHNMGAIVQLCKRVLWIDGGRIKCDGEPSKIVGAYLSSGIVVYEWVRPTKLATSNEVQLEFARILDNSGKSSNSIEFCKSFSIEIRYRVFKGMRDLAILARLIDSQGNIILTTWDTDTTGLNGQHRDPNRYRSLCKVPGYLLRPGRYWLSIGAHVNNIKVLDYYENALAFDVSPVGYSLNADRIGVITPLLEWEVQKDDAQVV